MQLNRKNLWTYLVKGTLPLPESIIPPNRPNYLWDILPEPKDNVDDEPGMLLDMLGEAIGRVVCDLEPPVGVWLSGGIDTSLLLYEAANYLGKKEVCGFHTFFGDLEELERAERISKFCGTKLYTRNMNWDHHLRLIHRAVEMQKVPTDCTWVLFTANNCRVHGVMDVLSGLGLDELMGGYPAHVKASDEDFPQVEKDLYEECQQHFVWVQKAQTPKPVDVHFPYLDPKLIAYCRGLPRHQKTKGDLTKVRLRGEMKMFTKIPMQNIFAGEKVGTKGGFTPKLLDWFADGLGKWCDQQIEKLPIRDKLKSLRFRRNYWIKLRLAALPIFYELFTGL